MADLLQYPILAANDPEGLAAPETDRLQWWAPLSLPVRARPPAQWWFATDPTGLGEAETDRLQWWRDLDRPVLPRRREPATWYATDAETLGDPAPDAGEWWAPLSEPVRPIPPVAATWYTIDPETLAEAQRDEIAWLTAWPDPVRPVVTFTAGEGIAPIDEGDAPVAPVVLDWFSPFGLPVPPARPRDAGWQAIDPATLADALRDEVQWFTPWQDPVRRAARIIEAGSILVDEIAVDDGDIAWSAPFDQPTHRRARSEPGQQIDDPATLGDAAPDLLEWLPDLSRPVLRRPDLASYPSTWIDAEAFGDALRDELQWFRAFSHPVWPRPDLAALPSYWIDPQALNAEDAEVYFVLGTVAAVSARGGGVTVPARTGSPKVL